MTEPTNPLIALKQATEQAIFAATSPAAVRVLLAGFEASLRELQHADPTLYVGAEMQVMLDDVARMSPTLDHALVLELIARNPGRPGMLTRNPAFRENPALVTVVLQQCLAAYDSGDPTAASWITDQVDALAWCKTQFDPATLRDLWARFAEERGELRIALALLLIEQQALTPEQLIALIPHLPPVGLEQVATHPAATPDVWCRLLAYSPIGHVTRAIAENPAARGHPRVRNHLLDRELDADASAHAPIVRALAASPAMFPVCVRGALAQGQVMAVAAMCREASPEQLQQLGRADLRALAATGGVAAEAALRVMELLPRTSRGGA